MQTSVLQAALEYQEAGLSVIPWAYVRKDGADHKTPRRMWNGKCGWKVDVVPPMTALEIRQHWHGNERLNVGIITGHASGIVVVDADTTDAVEWAHKNLPKTGWVVTTGRGQQFGFRAPAPEIKTCSHIGCRLTRRAGGQPKPSPADHRAHCAEGGACCDLDIRGHGGYVSMPPSLHKTGATYTWAGEEFSFDELPIFDPAWFPFAALLRGVPASTDATLLDFDDGRPDAPPEVVERARRQVALEPPAISGNKGRNQTFRVAAMLTRDFALSTKQAWDLLDAYNDRCQPPWSESALWGKLTDAYAKGTSTVGAKRTEGVVDGLDSLAVQAQPCIAPAACSTARPQAPGEQPTPSLSADDRLFRERTAAAVASGNPGYLFREDVLERTIRLQETNQEAFQNLQADIRKHVILIEWKKALKKKKAVLSGIGQSLSATAVDRVRVQLVGDEQALRDAILNVIKNNQTIYSVSRKLSHLDLVQAAMIELSGGALRNFVADSCDFVKVALGEDGTPEENKAPLPPNILQMLENLLPDHLEGLREVTQVARAPFFTAAGDLVQTPGYNAQAKVLLVGTQPIDTGLFATAEGAAEHLREVFADFEWGSKAEWTNYLAALLTPMVRHVYDGATPWLLLEANTQGAGKTLLASCVQLLHGYNKPKLMVLPSTEESLEKAMLATLSKSQAIIVIDNVKRALESATIEAIATSTGEFEGRILGKSENRTVSVLQFFIITSNNMTSSPDASRRFMRARLCSTAALTVDIDKQKAFHEANLPQYIKEHRGELLSALAKMVHSWLAAGRPRSNRVMPTFEVYSHVVGGILAHAGLPDWMANYADTRAALAANDDFDAFVLEWWAQHKGAGNISVKQAAGKLYEITTKTQLLGAVLAGANDEHARVSKLGAFLASKRDAVSGRFVVRVGRNDKERNIYWLEATSPVTEVLVPRVSAVH